MLDIEGFCYDIEADNLYLQSSTIWTIHIKTFDGRHFSFNPFKQDKNEVKEKIVGILNSFKQTPVIVAHNQFSYDAWMLWKFLDLPFIVGYKGKDYWGKKEVIFVDTFPYSQFLEPDKIDGHSLDALSAGYGSHKIKYRDKLIEIGALDHKAEKGAEFKFYHPLMEEYCEQDVTANIAVFLGMANKMQNIYGEWLPPSCRQHQKDYYLYCAQEHSGVKFYVEKAKDLVVRISEMMKEIEDYVLPKLPPRKLKKGEQNDYTSPAKPFKKNGEYSSSWIKWAEKHNGVCVNEEDRTWVFYGKEYKAAANMLLDVQIPMELKDGEELKDFFIEAGWSPSLYNLKRGPDGKPMRDPKTNEPIVTSPKIQEQGRICPNLEKLDGDLPKRIVRYLSLRNRRSVLEGWLNNWRIDYDGRLGASITGYTPTFRARHSVVCNVPKASPEVLLGAEFRELFVADGAYVGVDASALENRTLGHYTTRYDSGKYAELMLEGDPHTVSAFDFYPRETAKFDREDRELKENQEFKKYRNAGKTGNYLLSYGGSYKKLAKSLGMSIKDAEIAYENYWNSRPGLKQFKEALERYWETTGGKKFIPSIDGRRLSTRSKHVLVNLAGQSCGAIVMSYAACYVDDALGGLRWIDDLHRPYYKYKGCRVRRISMVHDEYSFEVWHEDKDIQAQVAEELTHICVDAIVKAGETLKLRIPLAGEGKVGANWKDVH